MKTDIIAHSNMYPETPPFMKHRLVLRNLCRSNLEGTQSHTEFVIHTQVFDGNSPPSYCTGEYFKNLCVAAMMFNEQMLKFNREIPNETE